MNPHNKYRVEFSALYIQSYDIEAGEIEDVKRLAEEQLLEDPHTTPWFLEKFQIHSIKLLPTKLDKEKE